MEVLVTNALVVDQSVFWLVAGGLVSVAVAVVMFEVGRLFRLVAAVRDLKEEFAEMRRTQADLLRVLEEIGDDLREYNRDNKSDHALLKDALQTHALQNDHDFDGLKERVSRVEWKLDDK